MITYAKVALALLQIVEIIVTFLRNKQQMDAGEDRAIAKYSASILARTQVGKEIWAEVQAMTEAGVDAGLKDLEPK